MYLAEKMLIPPGLLYEQAMVTKGRFNAHGCATLIDFGELPFYAISCSYDLGYTLLTPSTVLRSAAVQNVLKDYLSGDVNPEHWYYG